MHLAPHRRSVHVKIGRSCQRPAFATSTSLLLQAQTLGLAALQDFLADCTLMTLSIDASSGSDVQAEAVRLATLHGSKGLEFNTVFIVGACCLHPVQTLAHEL